MADSEVSWRSALAPQKAPTYGNQAMFITCPKELQLLNVDYIVVFEGTKKHHVSNAEAVNPFTLQVIIPEHDTAEDVSVKVFLSQNGDLTVLTTLKFTYISQMEHAIAKFLAQSASDPEIAEKMDAVWMICLGRDHQDLWDKRLAQAFVQLELPIEWTLVGDILQKGECEAQETLLHFAANHGLKELINVFLGLPGAKRALSTCNKSGLMPRDVARENGRLDLVELLDIDRFVENRKSNFSKDSGRRRVLRNVEHGVTTITNSRNHSIQEDIQLLRELNKLSNAIRGSPVNRHSWPIKASSFNPENYFEDMEVELSKIISPAEDLNNSKRPFLDENLVRLRDVTEELCQLRLLNSQRTSKEISVIADQNRRPMHSRRLSCPASVNRKQKGPQDSLKRVLPRHGAQTPESHIEGDVNQEDKVQPVTHPVSSTPPHSPTIDPLVNIASSAAITPPLDESPESRDETQETPEFVTPMIDNPTSLSDPTSPMPITYSTVEKRANSIRKDRPRTWYGGPVEAPGGGDMSRRSNSLEDFAKKFALDDTDDESVSEANSKGILQTMSSLVEKDDRSASFMSSLSDLSVGKESFCSESEVGREEGSDECRDFEEHVEDLKQREHLDDDKRVETDEHVENGELERNKEHVLKEEHGKNQELDNWGEGQKHQETDVLQDFRDLQEQREPEVIQESVETCELEQRQEIQGKDEPQEPNGFDNSNDRVEYGEREGHQEVEVTKEVVNVMEPLLGQSSLNGDQHEKLEEVDRDDDDDTLVEETQVNPPNHEGVGDDRTSLIDDEVRTCEAEMKSEFVGKESESEVCSSFLPNYDKEANVENYAGSVTTTDENIDEVGTTKHIRFEEKIERSKSRTHVDEKDVTKEVDDDKVQELEGTPFRQRSGRLSVSKTPVKRSGSDISVTSLQDVQLDMHTTRRDEDISPGILSNARKARSYGDLSAFRDALDDITKDDDTDEEDHENERKRIAEDQKILSVQHRIKNLENISKYPSSEKLDKIANSSITGGREEMGKRRWSNFFNAKAPKQLKKPGRTPTFRRDSLRSSMTSFKPGKSSGKKTIESLVAGPHATAFAKHSSTAPNINMPAPRPRSMTKGDSPGPTRKSSTVGSLDGETESLEEYSCEDTNTALDLEVDSDLENFDAEPEAWSVTVEKKVLKKMSTKEVKRQDVIMELIQTEGHHVRTLKLMQQVFYRGLSKQANYSADRLDQLFPRINQLVEISSRFLRNLRCRQDEAASVQMIGDVIVRQFSGENGKLLMEAYGEFVSRHQEAVALYKHYFKTDKKFSSFVEKCHRHRIVRRLSIPECFTLVTQRLTKYPILIEAIMKTTKSTSEDYKELYKALFLVKDALHSVDDAIKDYEKQSKLKDIKARMEKGSVVLKNGQKIKNSRFVDYQSKMIHDGVLQWKSARGKLTETHVVLLESMVAFLLENDKKFSLLSIDGKSPCIALKTLMVREVATDKNAIYFVSTSKKGPEMYEFVCCNPKEKKQWFAIISDAISKAPEDTGDLFQSPEEEKRLAEERLNRRNEILEIMERKDQELAVLIDQKNKLFSEMKDLLFMSDGNIKTKEDEKISSNEKARAILLSFIQRTTHLTVGSIQLHESHSDSELAAAAQDEKATAPKRSETFGGFDRRPSQKTRRDTATIMEGTTEGNKVSQRRDSGFSSTSLTSESVASTLSIQNQGQDGGPSALLQKLEALQWVLLQFSQKETALEKLRAQYQSVIEESRKLRAWKFENDKNQLLLKEAHQAELTRQKKAYSDLERTFNEKVEDLKKKLKTQEEQQQRLLSDFNELRKAVPRN